MKWNFCDDEKPPSPGWYPVLVCYDDQEGVFPMAAEWDGGKWLHGAVVGFGDLCDTQEKAQKLAYENDPDL